MARTPPKVTVIMPTYNWSNVLPFSIGSALDQVFADFELIVVGDGCTDDSEEVVKAIGDPRIRWINLPTNQGHQSAPNNEGLRNARGDLIAYLGHDDLWMPHHLACLVGAIEAGADMAYGVTRMVVPEGGRDELPVCRAYRPGAWLPPTSVIHRRALVEKAGAWRDHRELTVDPETDLWRRFHAAGARISFVPRLTAIKFSASNRRDVYRRRPSHEQAACLARIREEKDFEPVELARMLAAVVKAEAKPYGELATEFLRRTAVAIVRRLAGPRPGEVIERNRRFKGLDTPAKAGIEGGALLPGEKAP
jgi:glycosyltransferase involved in cell wall biosynthesis